MTLRYPRIYKYGIFKKALSFFNEGEILEAFKQLYRGFNIESLRSKFAVEENRKYTPMYRHLKWLIEMVVEFKGTDQVTHASTTINWGSTIKTLGQMS